MKSFFGNLPRPHDTGMVTLISQDLSEFALHARLSGVPVGAIRQYGPASAVILRNTSQNVTFDNSAAVGPEYRVRLFGKPESTALVVLVWR